ncbi:MAG: hypothetical protein BWK76_15435 [Desulfobulbaceae bacterium A2]|nr:MAG: hypothetical protein BWK76_15435 [Desulfobulbaceae bacterium A2]
MESQKKRSLGTLLVCCWLAWAVGLVVPAGSLADDVICFGDSITQGMYDEKPYPSHLLDLIKAVGSSAAVWNYGKGGETTNASVDRLPGVLAAMPSRYVIIMEGANDAVAGISPSTTAWDLGLMVGQVKGAGRTPILGNITPNTRDGVNDQITGSYNPEISRMAAKEGVTLVDQYSQFASNWGPYTSDGVHPNSAGGLEIAKRFFSVLSFSAAGGSDSGGGGGGCFIATAAYGSALSPQVQLLRRFRDEVLQHSATGRSFVRWYLKTSPPVAEYLRRHDTARLLTRWALYPLVGAAALALHQQLALGLVGGGLVLLGVFWVRRRAQGGGATAVPLR